MLANAIKWTFITIAVWMLCIVLFTLFHPAVGLTAIAIVVACYLREGWQALRRMRAKQREQAAVMRERATVLRRLRQQE
jgi:1,4-dihydroxy-2-naphthoate octaprenyltransferase